MSRLLMFALLALQGIIGILTLAQPVIGASVVPALLQSWVPALAGMQSSAPPVQFSIRTALNGDFQHAAQTWIGDHVIQRPAIVRSYNELLWRTFGTSYMANRALVRGRQDTLYEVSYILSYCGLVQVTDIAGLPAFARRLRVVEDWFKQRGQYFVYYSAPVKTSWYPDRIPDSFPCPAGKRDKVRPAALAALQQAGVDFVDGRAALEAQRGHVPVQLFPRNGIHWNWLGAAIGAEALVHKLHELGVANLPDLHYDVAIEPDETDTDRDIGDLLNLLWPLRGDPAPRLTIVPPQQQATLRFAAVNDSFFHYLPVTLLERNHDFTVQTVFGYLTLDQRRYQNNTIVPLKADMAEILQTLLSADVVVLEEVESRVGGPFALQFLDMIEAEIAKGGNADVHK